MRIHAQPACLYLALFLSACMVSQAQTGYVWCTPIQGPGSNENGYDVDCDAQGRIYICGSYDNNAVFNGTPYITQSGSDAYVCRLNASGQFEWVYVQGGPNNDLALGVRGSNSGVAYATGYGLLVFPMRSSTALHAWDGFTMRTHTGGTLDWGRALNGSTNSSDYSEGKDIAVDVLENSYTAGVMLNSGWYGSDTLHGLGLEDAYVAKFDSMGNFLWGQVWGGSQNDQANGVDVDGDGHVWVGGGFRGNADFGGISLTSAGESDGFVAKATASGNVQFVKQIFGAGIGEVARLKASADGDCYFAGNFQGTITIGSQSFTAVDASDIYYGKLDRNGNFLWARQVGGFDHDEVLDLEIDSEENVYFGGIFFGDLGMQGDTLVSAGFDDFFFAKTDSNGTLQLLVGGHDPGSRDLFGLGVDAAQNIVLTGFFTDTLTLGPVTHQSMFGAPDAYVAKYATRIQEIALTGVDGSPYCSSDEFTVGFEAWGYFEAGNVFSLELSDANGNFASPQTIGTIAGTVGGVVTGTVPASIASGVHYRVRIRSSLPALTSPDNGYDISLSPTTALPVEIFGDTVLCNGNPVVLWVDPGFMQQQWSTGDTGSTIFVWQAGTVWVEATDSNGCSNHDVVSVVNCVGMVPEYGRMSLRVVPNPAQVDGKGQGRPRLITEGLAPGIYHLQVLDSRGVTMVEQPLRLAHSSAAIPLALPSSCPAGIYHLSLVGPSGHGHLLLVLE